MNDVEEICNAVLAIAEIHPELRICQIIGNAACEAGWKNTDLFYLTDERLLEGLRALLNRASQDASQTH